MDTEREKEGWDELEDWDWHYTLNKQKQHKIDD